MNEGQANGVLRAVDVERLLGARRAVAKVSLTLRPGELLALLGPNGAGKTSLVEVLAGLAAPQGGTVTVGGPVGYAPQSLNLWPDLTPLEQLEFLGVMHGQPRATARAQGTELLCDLDLGDRAHDLARVLSGGMQRRLNLALAWTNRPRVAILDEPTVGLDPHTRTLVHAFLRQRVVAGAAVLLSTHDLVEAEKLADRVAIMDAGRLLAQGPPHQVTGGISLEERFAQLTGRSFQ